jgi:hypothetical protein
MVIFHSYVSLPEGIPVDVGQVDVEQDLNKSGFTVFVLGQI